MPRELFIQSFNGHHMDDEDPITQIFPGEDSVDLYAVLRLKSDATLEDIKKSYRRHALIYHPDKHASSSDTVKADASAKFQQIGFAYAVLSDEKRKARYDRTGRTDEGFEMPAGENGWELYFEDMFERVTRGKLDEMKKQYHGEHCDRSYSVRKLTDVIIGSVEEVEDIKSAYVETAGSIGQIMTYIPHSTHDDEARFIVLITGLISKGELVSLPAWESSVSDEKSRLVRKKQGEKEAKEAETLAKELGVWDEFYGTGKAGARKDKEKGKNANTQGDEEDHSALQALIMKKKKNMVGFFDNLAAKYAEPESKAKGKGKKRGKGETDGESQTSQKKTKRGQTSPDIDDDEFEKLQQKLFGESGKPSNISDSKGKTKTFQKAK
jgi:DnaJ family protein C protein 9